MNPFTIALLPAGLVMLCFCVLHIIQYPTALRKALALQYTNTLLGIFMTVLVWFEVSCALVTVMYIVYSLFTI